MTKVWVLLMMILSLLVFAAESVYAQDIGVQERVHATPLDAEELKNPIAAMKVSLPDAQLDYAIRERDDGRWEWKLFFTQNGSLGVCEIREEDNTIRKVEMYDRGMENALNAAQAMEKLAREKDGIIVTKLELDWDDGRLCYEGEARIGDRRYEFEMTADGRIIEWERD